MSATMLAAQMEEALAGLPLFDIHTHLVGGRLGARGLHDILLYHMVVSDLFEARQETLGQRDGAVRRAGRLDDRARNVVRLLREDALHLRQVGWRYDHALQVCSTTTRVTPSVG